jgi:ribosome biogenesis GTPase A
MRDYSNILERFYKIDAKGDAEVLLEELGKRKGFLKKGGEVNEDTTARLILKDWQTGKIKL